MIVRDLMTPVPVVCASTDHLARAAQLMWERDCGFIPVIDGAGTLAGIVTDRDLCMAAYTQGRPLHEIPISGVMSKVVFTIGPDASIVDALEMLGRRQVRRLPVVDAELRLIGVISLADFTRAARGRARGRPTPDVVAGALAGISAARQPEPNPALPRDVIVPAARRRRLAADEPAARKHDAAPRKRSTRSAGAKGARRS